MLSGDPGTQSDAFDGRGVVVDERPRRERAARALCRRAGRDENAMFRGRPMWTWYLDEVYLVLRAMDAGADSPVNASGTVLAFGRRPAAGPDIR